MAFIDKDGYGRQIVNINYPVGMMNNPLAIKDVWDDVVVVQTLLKLFYESQSQFRPTKSSNSIVKVTGLADFQTISLINGFQAVIMGNRMLMYIDKSPKLAKNSAISKLNSLAQTAIFQMGSSETVINYLKREHPMLRSSLFEGGDYPQGSDPNLREHVNQYDLT